MSRGTSAIALPNGKAYVFQGETYTRYAFETGQIEQSNLSLTDNWPGVRPGTPDASVLLGFGKAFFFYGDEYVRYELGSNADEGVEPEYLPPNPPFKVAAFWNGLGADPVDAAVNWGDGKIYFFRGPQYLRYDITLDMVDRGPTDIADSWQGVWDDGVDAALYQGGSKAYFFKGASYRRFNLDLDKVDDEGAVASLQLEPVPAAMLKPARLLTLAEANTVMGYLIQNGKLQLKPTMTPYRGDWQTGIASPQPSVHVVVEPTTIDGVTYDFNSAHQTLIDNVDQRMLVALYRLTRWINASEPDVSTILHKGIGHGNGPANDCHNQGRALDFAGVQGTSGGVSFDKRIQADWGNVPAGGGPMRLDPAIDPIAHLLFRTAFRFATYECECNGIGTANRWPPKEIGDRGGFVIHPDYVDDPGGNLRQAHQDHIHMQVGPTRI